MLEETTKKYRGKTAIVWGERRVSYAELDEASNKVANALIGLGVGKGERVAMLLPDSPEFVAIYFGIVKIGGIAVPLNIRHRVAELASLFDSAQPKVLVSQSPFLEPLVPALPRFKYIEHVIDLGSKHEGQFVSYQQIMATGSARRIEAEPEPEDIAHIIYASGPTTEPRGAMLSHQSLVLEAAISAEAFQQTDQDVTLLFALPMYHAFGLAEVLLTSIFRGSRLVMLSGLSISSLMQVIEKERVTIFMGVPYVYALVVNVAEREGIGNDLSSLRLCISAAAVLPVDIIRRFDKYFGLSIADCWGLTETVAFVTHPSPDGVGRPGSVGKVPPGWEIKIVDDRGKELPMSQPGEIMVKGPIMKGYYNNPQATAEMIEDGWLYTGDIGKVDEDGYLLFLKMKKELIIAKGQNIFPDDIEAVLNTHPKVAEVAVVGIPDELRGEIVRACISLKAGEMATEEEIRSFCRQQMANYKVPKQVIFLDSLPKTATGKIRKEDLKHIPLS